MYTNTSHREIMAIIALSGGIDTGAAPKLEKELTTLVREGNRKILLDFSDVTFISSGGLRGLLSTSKKITDTHVKFGLWCVGPDVNKIMKFTGVTTIFTIFSSVGDALDAWK